LPLLVSVISLYALPCDPEAAREAENNVTPDTLLAVTELIALRITLIMDAETAPPAAAVAGIVISVLNTVPAVFKAACAFALLP